MFKRILVPVDGTPHSNRAVKLAATLAASGATITIFHASPAYIPPMAMDGYVAAWPTEAEYRRAVEKPARKVMERAARFAGRRKVAYSHECSNAPAAAILEAARRAKAEAIVMTSHGRTGIDKLFLGSQAQKVIARSKVPVVVAK